MKAFKESIDLSLKDRTGEIKVNQATKFFRKDKLEYTRLPNLK